MHARPSPEVVAMVSVGGSAVTGFEEKKGGPARRGRAGETGRRDEAAAARRATAAEAGWRGEAARRGHGGGVQVRGHIRFRVMALFFLLLRILSWVVAGFLRRF